MLGRLCEGPGYRHRQALHLSYLPYLCLDKAGGHGLILRWGRLTASPERRNLSRCWLELLSRMYHEFPPRARLFSPYHGLWTLPTSCISRMTGSAYSTYLSPPPLGTLDESHACISSRIFRHHDSELRLTPPSAPKRQDKRGQDLIQDDDLNLKNAMKGSDIAPEISVRPPSIQIL